ncbi:MAG: ribosome maturation factor RimM [Leptospiraceae bacterium]|nr:ribosome maturation factor RimM [Leptospiraceae bacterium]
MLTNEFIVVGKIFSTHGISGWLKLGSKNGVISTHSQEIKSVFLQQKTFQEIKIEEIVKANNFHLIKFTEIDSVEDADDLVGKEIYLPREKILSWKTENEYFEFELLGFSPTSNGKKISEYVFKQFIENPAHTILQFQSEENEVLIPFIENFVGEINLEEKTIEIKNWEDWLAV